MTTTDRSENQMAHVRVGSDGSGSGSAIRLDEPRVLEAVTGVNRRSLELAAAIYDMIAAVGYRLTPQMEMELSNRIANHVIGAEWPEAAKFYAASLQNDTLCRPAVDAGGAQKELSK